MRALALIKNIKKGLKRRAQVWEMPTKKSKDENFPFHFLSQKQELLLGDKPNRSYFLRTPSSGSFCHLIILFWEFLIQKRKL